MDDTKIPYVGFTAYHILVFRSQRLLLVSLEIIMIAISTHIRCSLNNRMNISMGRKHINSNNNSKINFICLLSSLTMNLLNSQGQIPRKLLTL